MIYNYVVWNIVNLDEKHKCRVIHIPVASVAQGAELINAMAKVQLDVGENVIESNVFGLMRFSGGEWCEWEDDDGNNIEVLTDVLFEADPPTLPLELP